MKTSVTVFRLVSIALIIIVLGGLLGWYYFLRGQNAQVNAANQAAGYGTTAPTFTGSTGSTYANVVSTLGEGPGVTSTSSSSRLWEVSEVPVAGFGWLNGSSPTLDFVERSSGYVFNAQTQSRTVTRLTDTLRPKTYEASIALDGSVLERSIDDTGTLITFTGTIASTSASASSSVGDLLGNALPGGISTIAADGAYDTLFYLSPSTSGATLVSTNWVGQKEKQLFSSAITQWQLIAPGDGSLVLLQDPLDNVEGYAYRIQKSGALSLIAEAPGLTVLPQASTTALLYGASSNGSLSLFAQPSAGAPSETLPLQTVADKCAWAPKELLVVYCGVPQTVPSQQFLNDWYKGIVHTSDQFYEINASDASSTLIYDPSQDTSATLDVEDPSVDPTGQYLAFINGKDQSLWILRIAQ